MNDADSNKIRKFFDELKSQEVVLDAASKKLTEVESVFNAAVDKKNNIRKTLFKIIEPEEEIYIDWGDHTYKITAIRNNEINIYEIDIIPNRK